MSNKPLLRHNFGDALSEQLQVCIQGIIGYQASDQMIEKHTIMAGNGSSNKQEYCDLLSILSIDYVTF